MPDIGTLDYGPRNDEHPIAEALRKSIGIHAGKECLGSNQVFSVGVLDFIGQWAATWAIQNYGTYINAGALRLTSEGWAKAWVTGFVDWYGQPQNAAHRNDSGAMPNFLQTCYEGILIQVQRDYRNIPWTLAGLQRGNGMWQSGIPESAIERINMNLMGCTVDAWKNTKLRGNLGNVYLPSVCTYGALQLELGDEILSDWIAPPDPNHGHPFQTMCKLFNLRTGAGNLKRTDAATGRKMYEILSSGLWRIVVAEQKAPPCVITFFKTA